MKKGLLIYNSYNNVFNIGDYIQSLAANQFIGNEVDVYINRENLNIYKDEMTKLIMNGWFMHEAQNWPPSSYIEPLFVSFHINSVARELLLSPKSIEYLKKWQPIGCRDKETMRLLIGKGVDAYFSGCLTLTLGESYASDHRTNEVYFVDPYFEYKKDPISILKYGKILVSNWSMVKKISLSKYQKIDFASLIKAAAFFDDYTSIFDANLLANGNYIKQEILESDFESEDEKFAYAKELLDKYATARMVVTSRIHCALPSLGLETPVLYIENKNQPETSYCRLDGLRDLFNIISYDKGKMYATFSDLNNKIGEDFSLQNKPLYRKLKDALVQKVKEFTSVLV